MSREGVPAPCSRIRRVSAGSGSVAGVLHPLRSVLGSSDGTFPFLKRFQAFWAKYGFWDLKFSTSKAKSVSFGNVAPDEDLADLRYQELTLPLTRGVIGRAL